MGRRQSEAYMDLVDFIQLMGKTWGNLVPKTRKVQKTIATAAGAAAAGRNPSATRSA